MFSSRNRSDIRSERTARSLRPNALVSRVNGQFAKQIRRCTAFALLVAFAVAAPCIAATQPISGTITDTLGRPLARVKVDLRNETDAPVAHTVTDPSGHFIVAPGKAGVYSLDASKPGFKSAIKIVQVPRISAEPISFALDA
jgi:hypothetical protein